MRISSPSLPELHAFVAAARLGSFSHAAQALCVTQGAISRAIARLEEQLGRSLLERHGRGCTLNPAGQAYFDLIAPALDTLEQAAQSAKARRAAAALVLRIAVAPTLASHWLIRRLPQFQQRHPRIRVELVPYERGVLVPPGGDASLCSGDGVWPNDIQADYVVGREIVAVCRPQEVAGPRVLRQPQDLHARALLFHAHYPHTWRRWFAALGASADEPVAAASFEQVSQLLEAAVAGMGVAVVQRCLIDDHLADGRLVIAWPQEVANDRGYYLCYPKGAPLSKAMEPWRGWLLGLQDEPAVAAGQLR